MHRSETPLVAGAFCGSGAASPITYKTEYPGTPSQGWSSPCSEEGGRKEAHQDPLSAGEMPRSTDTQQAAPEGGFFSLSHGSCAGAATGS